LARGIETLRIMTHCPALSLDDLARRTHYPKSSLLRILETLAQMGLVERDDSTKTYYALQRLIPIRHMDADFPSRLNAALIDLSASFQFTAEWWIHSDEGMVLIERVDSPTGGAQVLARVGFLRQWNDEYD